MTRAIRTAMLLAGMVLALVSCLPIGVPAAAKPAPPRAPIVFTTWEWDATMVGPPVPGHRPRFSGIDRTHITSVEAALDPGGGSDWVVQYTLDAEGTRIFASITKQAAAACFDGCPESRVTVWLGLDQDDVDHWADRGDALYRPVDDGGKLVTDPYIKAPITMGEGYIAGSFSRQQAIDLARRLNGR